MFHKSVLPVLALALCSGQAHADTDGETIARARQAYYSLASRGFTGLECSVRPDWSAIFAEERKQNPTGTDRGVAALNRIRFTLSLKGGHDLTVAHGAFGTENAREIEGLQNVSAGLDKVLQGVFAAFGTFVVDSPLPSPSTAFELAEQPGQWLVTSAAGDTAMSIALGKDLVIRRTEVRTPSGVSTLVPTFKATPDGLLLGGYRTAYRPTDGSRATDLEVALAYQTIDGLQIPRTISMLDRSLTPPNTIPISLEDCRVSRTAAPAAPPIAAPPSAAPPASLAGTWRGTGHQVPQGSHQEWQIVMKIGESGGSIDYPSLGCGGTLTPLAADGGGAARYRETLTYGRDKCVDGGTVTASIVAGKLSWRWTGQFGSQDIAAAAELER